MTLNHPGSRVALCSVVFLMFSGAGLKAASLAYAGSSSGEFGTIDLSSGAFTPGGNSGQTLAGLAVATGSIFATSYHTANTTLFNVNAANGSLTTVGSALGVDPDDFGSTTNGLYLVSFGAVQDLYSLNPLNGAAALIGPTGLGYGSWRGLSTNSGTLYFADGPDLYTLNTSTGSATLIGAFGSSAQMGVLLTERGVLYGGDDTNNTLDTLDPNTGIATVGPHPSASLAGSFYGLAPNPVPTGSTTPEPGTWRLFACGAALTVLRRRAFKSTAETR